MNILVCIKQVPDSTHVEIDPESGNLKRESADSKINPFDLYALETALEIRDKTNGKVITVSMGPPQAEKVVRESLMLGADEGVLLSDRAFAGADVLATSYALFGAVHALGEIDLIICGKQTTDGDTAQVGPALAEWLKIPHVAWVTDILEIGSRSLSVRQNLDESMLEISVPYPCLITVEKSRATPRLPSYRRKKEFAQKDVKILSLKDLADRDPKKYGGHGSPTRVERIFPPEINSDRLLVCNTPEILAESIFKSLQQHKYIGEDL